MSSIMRARSGLMGVSLIGVLLVLRLGFGHPHPQARALHIPLPLALPGLNAASARVIAAGYRVSGFVPWHRPEMGAAAANRVRSPRLSRHGRAVSGSWPRQLHVIPELKFIPLTWRLESRPTKR